MPRGDKGAYTDKQKRKAEHIEEGYEKSGVSTKEAESRAWATVNAGWRRQESGRAAARREQGSGAQGRRKSRRRIAAVRGAKKGWETRRRRGNA